jgi:DNA-binding CsgD family transcriptional regulator
MPAFSLRTERRRASFRGPTARIEQSGLCAASSVQTMALRRLISLGCGGTISPEPGFNAARAVFRALPPLSVTVARTSHETGWWSSGFPKAIIFVSDPEQDRELRETHLRAHYGLTRAEARVAGLVLEGGGVKAVARRLAVAPSTVRSHLHNVFEKTGTKRQAEVANLVNQIAPISRPLSSQRNGGRDES